jgi:hypothetical protein
MIGQEHLRRQMKDPFFKYFKQVPRPDGVMTFQRRLQVPPGARLQDYDKGVTREAADIFKERTGKAYTGTLLPVAKDSTYKSSSFGKADAAKAQAQAKETRRTASQKTLFGGDVKTLFPSQRRDLTRRRMAKKQVEKTKKTLGK